MADRKYYAMCDSNCKFETMTKEQILTAITQAVENGTIGDIDTGFVTTVKTIGGTPLKFFVGRQSEYEALTDEQKENLFALITNDTTKEGILAAVAELERKTASCESNVISAKKDIAALEKRVTACEENGGSSSGDISSLAARVATCENDIDASEANISNLELKVDSIFPAPRPSMYVKQLKEAGYYSFAVCTDDFDSHYFLVGTVYYYADGVSAFLPMFGMETRYILEITEDGTFVLYKYTEDSQSVCDAGTYSVYVTKVG